MTDDRTPVERLTAAVQAFVNEIDPEAPVLLRGCVVVWESMILDEDGDAAYKTSYATGDGTGMSSGAGLLHLGLAELTADLADRD